jgi:hypothetical protein
LIGNVWPDEQRFFFDHVMPSKDAWGAAFCCGTSSVIRMPALEEIGGFPTDSVTEDFLLTLELDRRGVGRYGLGRPAMSSGAVPPQGGNAERWKSRLFSFFTRLLEVISRSPAGHARSPAERPFSNVQLYFHQGEYCEHLKRFLRRNLPRPSGPPACPCRGVTVALCYPGRCNWFFSLVKAGPRLNQEARQRCDGIQRVAPPGS